MVEYHALFTMQTGRNGKERGVGNGNYLGGMRTTTPPGHFRRGASLRTVVGWHSAGSRRNEVMQRLQNPVFRAVRPSSRHTYAQLPRKRPQSVRIVSRQASAPVLPTMLVVPEVFLRLWDLGGWEGMPSSH